MSVVNKHLLINFLSVILLHFDFKNFIINFIRLFIFMLYRVNMEIAMEMKWNSFRIS
jgi:hypothetical protein